MVTRGNIPAYAGKTQRCYCPIGLAAEHPRVCGENVDRDRGGVGGGEHPRVCGENSSTRRCPRCGLGTSPRMRGKPPALVPGAVLCRNIPAYAGKTCLISDQDFRSKEHPRVCGENGRVWGGSTCGFGTSPRMRGKHHPDLGLCSQIRNIPAYAGKTCSPGVFAARYREHPRVCGENVSS